MLCVKGVCVSMEKKKWIPAVLAAILTIPTAAFAADTEVKTEKPSIVTEVSSLIGHAFGGHMFKHGAMDEQKWLEIVKQYTPDQVDEWQKAINERKALWKQLNTEQVKKGIKAKREKMKKEREAAFDKLIDQLVNKEITKEQFKQQLKELKTANKWLPQASMKETRELRKQLHKAIKEKDRDAIATLLPKWLKHIQAENQRLAQLIKDATQK